MRSHARLVAACVVLTLGSCGDASPAPSRERPEPSPTAQESRIEREIRTSLRKHARVAVVAECPSPGRWRAGKTFGCTVIWAEGGRTKVPVTMKRDGTFAWSIRMAG